MCNTCIEYVRLSKCNSSLTWIYIDIYVGCRCAVHRKINNPIRNSRQFTWVNQNMSHSVCCVVGVRPPPLHIGDNDTKNQIINAQCTIHRFSVWYMFNARNCCANRKMSACKYTLDDCSSEFAAKLHMYTHRSTEYNTTVRGTRSVYFIFSYCETSKPGAYILLTDKNTRKVIK